MEEEKGQGRGVGRGGGEGGACVVFGGAECWDAQVCQWRDNGLWSCVQPTDVQGHAPQGLRLCVCVCVRAGVLVCVCAVCACVRPAVCVCLCVCGVIIAPRRWSMLLVAAV